MPRREEPLPFRRCLLIRTQVVMGLYDEDGNLTGTEALPMADLYYPWTGNLEKLIDRAEREALREEERNRA